VRSRPKNTDKYGNLKYVLPLYAAFNSLYETSPWHVRSINRKNGRENLKAFSQEKFSVQRRNTDKTRLLRMNERRNSILTRYNLCE
jgi:hypothetical protein